MNAPRAISLLDQAIESLRPRLAQGLPVKARIRALWATAKKARDLGSADQVHAAFMSLAVEMNLIDEHGRYTCEDEKQVRPSLRRYGRQDIEHIITWALRGWNPFEEGPLK